MESWMHIPDIALTCTLESAIELKLQHKSAIYTLLPDMVIQNWFEQTKELKHNQCVQHRLPSEGMKKEMIYHFEEHFYEYSKSITHTDYEWDTIQDLLQFFKVFVTYSVKL